MEIGAYLKSTLTLFSSEELEEPDCLALFSGVSWNDEKKLRKNRVIFTPTLFMMWKSIILKILLVSIYLNVYLKIIKNVVNKYMSKISRFYAFHFKVKEVHVNFRFSQYLKIFSKWSKAIRWNKLLKRLHYILYK